MAEGPGPSRTRKSLFSGNAEDDLEQDASLEFDELMDSLEEMSKTEQTLAAYQMSPSSTNQPSFMGLDGTSTQQAAIDELRSSIQVRETDEKVPDSPTFGSVTPMKSSGNPGLFFTPKKDTSLFQKTPARSGYKSTRMILTPSTPKEISIYDDYVADTPAGSIRLSLTPAARRDRYEGPNMPGFNFGIWEDRQEDTSPFGGGGPAARERMTRTACLRQSLVCGQVYSSRGELVSRGIRTFSSAVTVIGDGVSSRFVPVMNVDDIPEEVKEEDKISSIGFGPGKIARILISKRQFVSSRVYGATAIRIRNNLRQNIVSPQLPVRDRRFVYILPAGGERESGFFYINLEYYHKRLGGVEGFPIISVGFNVRLLAYFITEAGFSQRFHVEVFPGLVITISMEGVVTKGIKNVTRNIRMMNPTMPSYEYENTLVLSLSSVTVYYPMDWFSVFPEVARLIPGYRRPTVPVPFFSTNEVIDLEMCHTCHGKMDPPLRCKQCKKALYCSQECQISGWLYGHKLSCKKK